MIFIFRIVDDREKVAYTGVYSEKAWNDRIQRVVNPIDTHLEEVMNLSIDVAISRLEGIPEMESVQGDECIFLNAEANTVVEFLRVFSPR